MSWNSGAWRGLADTKRGVPTASAMAYEDDNGTTEAASSQQPHPRRVASPLPGTRTHLVGEGIPAYSRLCSADGAGDKPLIDKDGLGGLNHRAAELVLKSTQRVRGHGGP